MFAEELVVREGKAIIAQLKLKDPQILASEAISC